MHDYQRTLLREKFLSALAASVNDAAGVFCDESHVNKFNTYRDFAYTPIARTPSKASPRRASSASPSFAYDVADPNRFHAI